MGKKTHFGNKTVNESEKQSMVDEVFNKSSKHYDMMNDIMSGGLHRHWKTEAVKYLRVQPHHKVCDIAAGSGDVTLRVLDQIKSGHIYMTDINENMLNIGYDRILNTSVNSNKVTPLVANGEKLPFEDKIFDRMICAFGVRNMTNIDQALKEFQRCLKLGGIIVILEFSKVIPGPINNLYQIYSEKVIPSLGELFAKDRESYQYLVDSIKNHPNQEEFAKMMRDAGFKKVSWHNLTFGAVAIHIGTKI